MRKIITFLLILFVFQGTVLFAEEVRIGTTFSPLQCEYFGMDWKKAYLAILDEGFDIIRVSAYWDEIEKEEGVYDFTVLDWQVEQARKKGVPVVLAVGIKVPRWPEYHIPDWLEEQMRFGIGAKISNNRLLREKTFQFIEKTVLRYKAVSYTHLTLPTN